MPFVLRMIFKLLILLFVSTVSSEYLISQNLFDVDSVYVKGETSDGEMIAPDWTWKENDTEQSFYQISDGKITLINIWGTWCGPCKDELPDLAELDEILPDDKFLVLGVAFELSADKSKVRSVLNDKGVEYRNFYCPLVSGQPHELLEALGMPHLFPTTLIVDHTHKVVETIGGGHDMEFFKSKMEKYLSAGNSGENQNGIDFDIYPNPVSDGAATIRIDGGYESAISLELADMTGKVVYTNTIDIKHGEYEYPAEFSDIPAGGYFLKVRCGEREHTKNLIIIK